MKNNEHSKEGEIAIEGGMSSLRRKYLKGKDSNINYGAVLKHKLGNSEKPNKSLEIGEEIVKVKKEIITQRSSDEGIVSSVEEASKIKSTKIDDNREDISMGKLSEKKEAKGKKSKIKQNSLTQKEISIESQKEMKQSNLSENKTFSNEKGENKIKIAKTNKLITSKIDSNKKNQGTERIENRGKNEIIGNETVIKNISKNQRNIPEKKDHLKITTISTKEGVISSRRSKIREDITTATTKIETNNFINQRNQQNSAINNSQRNITNSRNSEQNIHLKKEIDITIKTTTSINQTNLRNQSNRINITQSQNKSTRVTTISTNNDNPLRSGNDKKQISSSKSNSIIIKNISNNSGKNKPDINKTNSTNQRVLINQKSTPTIGRKNSLQNTNIKDNKNKSLSIIYQEPELRNNISSISIIKTGKYPKKQYVLNVRKTDVIQRKNKIKMVYNNDPNVKKPIVSNLNHNIKFVKNVTKELPTVENLPIGTKIIHRYNYAYNPNISNTRRHEINETGKIPKKQVIVKPRKIDIIKTERKPLKTEINTNQGTKIISVPINKKDKSTINIRPEKNVEEAKKRVGNESRRSNNKILINLKGTQNASSSRKIKAEENKNRNKVDEKTNRIKINDTTTSEGKTKRSNFMGKENITKITTETKIGSNYSQIRIARNANKKDSSKEDGKSNKFNKNKIESIVASNIILNDSSKNKRNKNVEDNAKAIKISKITIVKVSETTSNNSGTGGKDSIRLRFTKGNQIEKKEEPKMTKVETDEIKASNTTNTKNESSDRNDDIKIKKFRSKRRFKK